MTRPLLTTIFVFLVQIVYSQNIHGIVEDFETGDKEEDVDVVLMINDTVKYKTTTNKKGEFVFNNIKVDKYNLVAIKIGHSPEKLTDINPKTNNDYVIMFHQAKGGFICSDPVKFVCEEDNPNYEYLLNSKPTTNYIDSAGQKQGAWYYTYDRHTQPKSEYRQNALTCKGFYKNDRKVGRWIYLKPNGTIDEVVTYENDHIINRTKQCVAH